MSKVEAYICDCCGKLFPSDAMVGLSFQDDMIDKELAFPTIPDPAKAFAHYSTECYREQVLVPASNLTDRKQDEHVYKLKVKELAYGLRRKAVFRYNEKQRFRQGRKKK